MRIAIDVRKLRDFGIGTYVRNLLRQLARLDTSTEYVLLCQPGDEAAARVGPNFRTVVERGAPYSFREQLTVPATLRRERVDLFHTPHYVLPPLVGRRSVVTIHDCIHLMFPQYLPSRLAYSYARTFMWSAARRAHRILTVSEASKRDILRWCRVPEDKVTVIPNAIDDRFRQGATDDEIRIARERYQLYDPYVLYVGNVKPHKNIERLIDAFGLVHRDGLDHVKLLIIGDEISKHTGLRRAVHRNKLHTHVRFLGYVPDGTLAALYRLAGVFVFPSLYEGFGLPPLEAMASGTPVVTSNVSSLPEVVGDAALLIDPYDTEAIADAIRRVLTDEHLRCALSARGLARAALYSWERSVERVREIYEEVGRR